MDSVVQNPILVIALTALATYASRAAGAFLAGRVSIDSQVVEWITCVTYALMAGLVVRMIILPLGSLSATPLAVRLGAAGVGLLVFFATHKNVGASVLAGSLTLIALTWI